MPTDNCLYQPYAPGSLDDDFVLDDFYDLAFPDELESADNIIRQTFNCEPHSFPSFAPPHPTPRRHEAVQVMNFTSHIFRGFSSTRLQFSVLIKPECDPTVAMLLQQKRLFAEASLSTPRKLSDAQNHRLDPINMASAFVKYKWHHDLHGKQRRVVNSSSNNRERDENEANMNSRKIQLQADKDGRLNYEVAVEVRQEFLSSQAAHYEIDVARDMGLACLEVIYLLIELKDSESSVVTAACSFPIYVTNFAFSIEERFSSSPFVKRLATNYPSDPMFAWYSKNGGDNASVDLVIHLRDSKGRFVSNHSSSVPTTTQLVYIDGSPAPEMPLAPLKERKTASTSANPLFRRVRADPIILSNQSSADFGFRIEEVSMHHLHKGGGFRVRVYTEEPMMRYLVSPGMLDEIIIVRSKAKKGELISLPKMNFSRNLTPGVPHTLQQVLSRLKQIGSPPLIKTEGVNNMKPNSSIEAMSYGRPTSSVSHKARKISVELHAPPILDVKSNSALQAEFDAIIPTHDLYRCLYNETGRCLWCHKESDESDFLQRDQHLIGCVLSSSILATLQVSGLPYLGTEDCAKSNFHEAREPENENSHSEGDRIKPPDDLIFDLDAFLDDIAEQQTSYNPRESSATSDGWPHVSSSPFEALNYSSSALYRLQDFDVSPA